MSSPFPSSSNSDILDTQTAYMAHLYSLFESYCNFQHPDAPTQSQPSNDVEMKPLGLMKNAIECRLCGDVYQTPAQLAQHSCPKMTPIAFQCRDCQKAFSCSANLASHQRWHRPKSASFFPKKTHQHQQPSQQQQQNRVRQPPQTGEIGKNTPSTPRKPLTPASTSRSTPLYQRNDIRRRASFSIESILRPDHKKREPYICFRCEEQLSSQSDFEDHIIDHLLCSR